MFIIDRKCLNSYSSVGACPHRPAMTSAQHNQMNQRPPFAAITRPQVVAMTVVFGRPFFHVATGQLTNLVGGVMTPPYMICFVLGLESRLFCCHICKNAPSGFPEGALSIVT